jgi:hypothetical protein
VLATYRKGGRKDFDAAYVDVDIESAVDRMGWTADDD